MLQHKIKNLFFLIAFIAASIPSFSSHLLGGEIVWECMPSGQYRFTLTLYRDCTGIPLNSTTETLATNSGASIPCTKISVNYINKECGALPCGSVPNGYIGAIEQHVYRSAPVTLNGTPPVGGWYFSWTDCCRPGTVSNLSSPGGQSYVLRALMHPYTPGGSTNPLPANPCYDDSPDFLEAPDITVCSGFDSEYLSLGSDKNLDSLYYEWAAPKNGGSFPNWTTVNYLNSTYSPTSPLPGPVHDPNNVAATLNGELGQIKFKSYTTGGFTTCIKISEYRCNQLIGEVYRDIPIFVKPCTPPTGLCGGTPNNAPTVSFGYDPGFPQLTPIYVNGVISHYEMTVYAKTHIKFKMTGQDVDLQPNCVPQQIEFKGKGGNLSPFPYNNTSNCSFQAPCATITSLNSSGTFVSSLNNDVEFNWQTTCDHLDYTPTSCGVSKNTYDFYFRFEDNACPIPATSYATVKITVENYPPIPPDLTVACMSYDANGALSFDFIPPTDTGIQFDYYEVYRSNNGGNYAPIATIANYSATSFTDLAPPTGVNAYYMRTYGGCSLISEPSDTIQSIQISLTASPPPPNSSVAMLSWNYRNPNGSKGEIYQIWREVCGTNNWSLIDSTTSTTYNDTVNLCGDCLKYQIRIKNACLSTVDSAYLSDQNNNDVIAIDTVSVVGGLATLSFDTTTVSNDVIKYIVLKQDANGSWVPIADLPRGVAMPYTYMASLANQESEKYKVVTMDSCGNQSSDLNATAHGTLFLNVNSDPCDGFVSLRWNAYETWTKTAVSKYEVFADITQSDGTFQKGVLVYQGGPADLNYKHTNVISGSQYCYYVKVTDTTGLYTSTSNIKCIDALVIQKSRLLYMARATVKNENSVEVYGFIDKDADVQDYGIERADNINGPYFVLGRIPKPTVAPYEVKYTDYTASPSTNKYFYRIVSRDSCGSVDTISNLGRNIYLSVVAQGNLTNKLAWNPYEEWGGTVDRYEIYRQINDNGNWSLVDQVSGTDTTFIDNIRTIENSNGSFCYYVKAYEANNPIGFVDEFGLPFSSVSNQACAVQEARVFVPTAFNPNSDISDNKIWKPSNVFAETNTYKLIVMNRWGEKVFQTTDLNAGWDGSYNGTQQTGGVYTYFINYKSLDGVLIEERGNFTLIN